MSYRAFLFLNFFGIAMSVLFALVAILVQGWWQVALFAAAILYFAMQIKSENAAQLFHQNCSEAIKDEATRRYRS
jgi:hypothetical protein